jgi:hypothetical protein
MSLADQLQRLLELGVADLAGISIRELTGHAA